MREGLVDEIHLVVSPGALGEGGPVFDRPTGLETLEVRRLDGSPNVPLRYAPARS